MNDAKKLNVYIWQELNPDDQRWGMITAQTSLMPVPIPLIARDQRVAEVLKGVALSHYDRTGHRVRLARYEYAETIEQFNHN